MSAHGDYRVQTAPHTVKLTGIICVCGHKSLTLEGWRRHRDDPDEPEQKIARRKMSPALAAISESHKAALARLHNAKRSAGEPT